MIVYKPRNIVIPVEVKDECRLLIKTIIFTEYSAVHLASHDAADYSCGPS
jgi:hypothetical protein